MYAFDSNDSLQDSNVSALNRTKIVYKNTSDRTKVVHKIAVNVMTFHCGQCNTVLGDSFGICGEAECFGSIICTKVTQDVVVSDELESELEDCFYNTLTCSGCNSLVGLVIYSAPKRLAILRSLFLIRKENINCYHLSSGTMTKASTLKFDLRPIGKSVAKLKRQAEAQLEHISQRLTELSISEVD